MVPRAAYVAPDSVYYVYTPSQTAIQAFLYPLQCGAYHYLPGYSIRRNSFDSFLLLYVEQGAMEVRQGGQAAGVAAGQFALLDCYRPHAYASAQGCRCLWCHFDGAAARALCSLVRQRLGLVITPADPDTAAASLRAIVQSFAAGALLREPLLSKHLHDILTELLLAAPPAGRQPGGAAAQCIAYINEHFAEDLPLEKLAAQVGLSPYHFSRLFKRETGYTPHEYLLRTRLSTARYLLKTTARTVKEIGYDTGFSSESRFCSVFKRQEGMTPTAYRLGAAGAYAAPGAE